MKEVSINPTGFDWGNLGWVPRNFSVERWGVAEESKEQVRMLKGSIWYRSRREHPPTENEELKKTKQPFRENFNIKIFVEFNLI